jgi:heme/copper-type cytochrome/quinol oxidase subunit 3
VIPYTTTPRQDSGVSNVTLGIWLFLASEVMLFGALFSCYALIRMAATTWPHGSDVLNLTIGGINTAILLGLTVVAFRARRGDVRKARMLFGIASLLATAFLVIKGLEYRTEISHGLLPATNTFMATYFTFTGVHALHVIGGLIANIWVIFGVGRVGDDLSAARIRNVSLYWMFVDVIWWLIFGALYVG